MMSATARRIFALLLCIMLLLSMLPSAFAEDAACLEGCSGDSHAEGCPNAPAPPSGKEGDGTTDPEPATLTSISVAAAPSKTSYVQGESLDVTGGKITLTYSDSTTSTIDMTAEMVSGFDSTTAGTRTLTVTYSEKTATFEVTVTAATPPATPTLTSISVSAAPAKVSYTVGETLVITGGKITLTYSDSTTSTIDMTAEMVSGFDSTAAGSKTLTVTYESMTATFDVTVTEASSGENQENNTCLEGCSGDTHAEGCPNASSDPAPNPVSDPIQSANTVALTVNGQTITVGMGILSGNSGMEYITMADSDIRQSVAPNAADPSMRLPICFAAMVIDGSSTAHASGFYTQEILDTVSFEILSCKNPDNSDQNPRKLTVSAPQSRTYDGVTSKFVDLTVADGSLFDATIAMHFTYGGQQYTITKRIWREQDSVAINPSETIDTTQELNAVLASNEALFQWLQTVHPTVYNDFVNNPSASIWIDLVLPAAAYDDIVCNVDYTGNNTTPNNRQFQLRISGSTSGSSRTTMKSLKTRGSVKYVKDILFAGDASHTIAIAPVDAAGRLPDSILGCSFKNYSRAISLTGRGNVENIQECVFDSCTTGIYVDSGDTGSYDFTSSASYGYNIFFKNSTAVHIAKLPPMVTPFHLRVSRNIFLSDRKNSTDFKVQPEGKFFFQQNFYGDITKSSATGSNTVDYWFENHANDNAIRSHATRDVSNSTTKLITNPFLKTLGDWKATKPTLWLTDSSTAATEILASEAPNMPIDGAAFSENTGRIHVSILEDDTQQEIAGWTFNGSTNAE